MGLDVNVYKNVKLVDETNLDFDFMARVIDPKWINRIKNLEQNGAYKGERIRTNIAYPCSYHNAFRDELCSLLGFEINKWRESEMDENVPFYEFFEFADNDGCIDWETSEKLYNDFKEKKNEVFKNKEKIGCFYFTYLDWMEVFKAGMEKNCVIVYS